MKSSSQNQRDNETTVKKICIFVWHIYSNKCMYNNYRDCTAGVYRITNQFQTQYRSWWNTPTNVCNSSPGFFFIWLIFRLQKSTSIDQVCPKFPLPIFKVCKQLNFLFKSGKMIWIFYIYIYVLRSGIYWLFFFLFLLSLLLALIDPLSISINVYIEFFFCCTLFVCIVICLLSWHRKMHSWETKRSKQFKSNIYIYR